MPITVCVSVAEKLRRTDFNYNKNFVRSNRHYSIYKPLFRQLHTLVSAKTPITHLTTNFCLDITVYIFDDTFNFIIIQQ